MRVPLSWLGEFVDIELTPEQLAERLTLLGMEVSAIEHLGADWGRVVVGELLEVAPHPNSAKLSLTRVSTGHGRPELSIVCGATNIAVGQRVPVALPGSVLPGERRIDITTIAGVASQGMLCSGDELGLTGDAEGILILPEGTRLGVDMAELAGDIVLDIDVKPNRGDALSILGLAREVAAATGASLRWPDLSVTESGDRTSEHLRVEVADPDLCPTFVGRYVEGVSVGPSPWEVQKRLISAGVRPISNVVDASNYVLMELGKPIHTFDADAVTDGHIVVRLAEPGERLETLDHVERALTADTLLIADPAGPLAIAGVMGGAASEVGEATTNVIIESAIFDPVSVRRTAFRYSLRSEASLRFEKGQEQRMARLGADRTAALIQAWGGGRVASGAVDTGLGEPEPSRIPFRPARVDRLLGEDIPLHEQRALLARVEIRTEDARAGDRIPVIAGSEPLAVAVTDPREALVAIVPGHRRDLAIEGDIIEEIARIRGYETLAARLPDTAMPAYRPDPRHALDALRSALAGAGLSELVTHGLIGPEDHARLGVDAGDATTIRATNPVTLDHSELRRSLLPEHLRVLVENERQRRPDFHAFEVGTLHEWRDGDAVEHPVLGLLLAGRERPVTFDRPALPVDVATAKGLLEQVSARLLRCRLLYEPVRPRDGVEHPGRTAGVVALAADGERSLVGRVGEVHPDLLERYQVRAEHVVFAEIDLDAYWRLLPQRPRVGKLEHLPGVERDIALVVAAGCPAGEVEAIIREHGGANLRSVSLFDRYRGAPLDEGQISLAYRLRFEAGDDPLGEDEIEAAVVRVVSVLNDRLGARLRA
ncbi:MAG: phenylalanine--tRNA ligase subunit beta [Candidatus Limnocylindrales bacterium]